MRGMLVHYLIERGFSYEDARAVANAVRASLGKVEFVRKKDMVQLVHSAIRKGFRYARGRRPNFLGAPAHHHHRRAQERVAAFLQGNCCRIPFRRLGCPQTRATRLRRRLKRA